MADDDDTELCPTCRVAYPLMTLLEHAPACAAGPGGDVVSSPDSSGRSRSSSRGSAEQTAGLDVHGTLVAPEWKVAKDSSSQVRLGGGEPWHALAATTLEGGAAAAADDDDAAAAGLPEPIRSPLPLAALFPGELRGCTGHPRDERELKAEAEAGAGAWSGMARIVDGSVVRGGLLVAGPPPGVSSGAGAGAGTGGGGGGADAAASEAARMVDDLAEWDGGLLLLPGAGGVARLVDVRTPTDVRVGKNMELRLNDCRGGALIRCELRTGATGQARGGIWAALIQNGSDSVSLHRVDPDKLEIEEDAAATINSTTMGTKMHYTQDVVCHVDEADGTGYCYIANGPENNILVVNLRTFSVARKIQFNSWPWGMAVSPDGLRVLGTADSGSIEHDLQPEGGGASSLIGKVTKRKKVARRLLPTVTGSMQVKAAYDTEDNLYVADNSGLYVMPPTRDAVVKLATGSFFGVAIDTIRNRLFLYGDDTVFIGASTGGRVKAARAG